MRHLKRGRKFGRNSAHRQAMWRNMTTSLIVHERIKTTDEKAKELRHYVEKMITLAKRARSLGEGGGENASVRQLHLRRQALSFIREKDAVKKLFDELAARFADRPGGYTRVLKVGTRHGDSARISLIELLGADEKTGDKKHARKKPKPKAKTKPAKSATPAPAEEPETPVAPETVAEPAVTPETPAAEPETPAGEPKEKA